MPSSPKDLVGDPAKFLNTGICISAELGFDRVYTEPVRYPVWTRGEESLVSISPSTHQFSVAALGGSMGTGAKGIEAEVLQFSDYKSLSEAAAGFAIGKIVFINYQTPRRSGRRSKRHHPRPP